MYPIRCCGCRTCANSPAFCERVSRGQPPTVRTGTGSGAFSTTMLLRRRLTSKRKTLFIHGDLLYLVHADRVLIFRIRLLHGTPLRVLLASYLEERPSHLIFSYSANGKHERGGINESCGLRFDVSRSGDSACVGVTFRRRSGEDTEAIRYDEEIKPIAQRFFSFSEQRDLASLVARDQHQSIFNCGPRKEAHVKALGSGWSLPLSKFDASRRPVNPPVYGPRVQIRTRRSVGSCWSWRSARNIWKRSWPRAADKELTCRERIRSFGSGDADANS